MTTVQEKALAISKQMHGKFETHSKVPVNSMADLSVAYTPGVAAVCTEIAKNPESVYEYTSKRNLVAVITDGSAVLGLGNIGPEAAIPVMEGKAILFKQFANVDAIPLSINTQDPDELVKHIAALAPSFGGINLEDISAPRCFEIEKRLQEILDIPVFHDDQHGTAIVVLAALYNALKVAGKSIESAKVVINGGGAAGLAIADMLLAAGVSDLKIVDKIGILSEDDTSLPPHHLAMAKRTNKTKQKGTLEDAVKGADVFIGVSAPGVLKPEWVKTMAEKSIIFAMANPTPEIFPDEAKAAGAYIVGTGRSDYPNQINNVLAFPGIFRGALDARAKNITLAMQLAAAKGLANIITPEKLSVDCILPNAFEPNVAKVVAESVKNAAKL
ncbi:NADP-dependent malic enzyme [Gilliamella sp. W8126]|uniref:NAD-dependent malic enzyme n=2 Tax=Gilliamella TaxID=1193503 RepID=A0A2V4E9P2_9GAMM|nr:MULTISPECIES: NADP-dependent malic enzyme [Gilliamella]MBI0005594.1 NADP-dependent malic enzyme [Gilliamella sp. W8126]MBI0037265.1 NADP-dependent malic enzyme [Gilliamella sp. B14384G10]MBI0039082.1 NADP-dependent malic enzyme [Gilliamella sp. B14384G7]MBI0051259.1 NADP-dependent malic enzyme [Gilliamella sp. B14384G13]MBI0053552.1 NADP-dependent malic enzyme [Gilliamella sp. B14384H2]